VNAALAALALALAWPTVAGAPQAQAAGRTVPDVIVGFTFVRGAASLNTPGQPFTIRTGDTVTWTNLDAASHDVTFDVLPKSFYLREPGASAELTFDRPGYFTYSCVEHPEFPGMRGLVIVSDSAP
jgi:plastocyanin